jgi:two-component system, response regulator PdtaR
VSAGSRIVIAEDEAIIRLDLKELLIEEGYDVIGETGRGDEALELVRRLRPDVAILDIKMPGADGLTVARAVASEHLCAILIVTAFSQRELIEQARDAGALAYIVKPFERTDLVPAIELALGRFSEMQSLQEEISDLSGRLEERKLVDRAKGILMATGLAEDDAFKWLRTEAMSRRVRIGDVARLAIEEGLRPR